MAPAVKNTRQGAVMEGLFAMYCAAYLIDPNHGQSISEVKKFINSLAVDTELKELSKANSNSVTYNKTSPNELGKSVIKELISNSKPLTFGKIMEYKLYAK